MEKHISITEELLKKVIEAGFSGRKHDLSVLIRVISSQIENESPTLAQELRKLAASKPIREHTVLNPHKLTSESTYGVTKPHMLIKATDFIVFEKSVFESNIENEIQEIIKEHRSSEKLTLNGLNPIKTVLFEGPPGVGKTYSAKWIAQSLGLPLYILDLASVMNSHLGKTGNNIKEVFQYISDKKCILLLDEFDAIAKKRDDASDVGELKRLVTVLLQALDHQSDSSLIIAATNHSELLDPAVWRRFEKKLSFGKPSDKAVLKYVNSLAVDTPLTEFSFLFKGMNFSDILHRIKRVQKLAVLNNTNVIDELLNTIAEDMKSMNILDRKKIGKALIKSGHSHREAAKRANLSRPTLIKYINENMDV